MLRKKIVIAGANSAIALCISREMCARGAELYLLGRDQTELERNAADLTARCGKTVHWSLFEATDYDSHSDILKNAESVLGGLDGLLVAFGTLGDQLSCQDDISKAQEVFDVNFSGAASLLGLAANRMEENGGDFLVALSSVAGDRGRKKNYVYGAAKGALSIFLQGLRNRLCQHGIQVLTVKPGPVSTPMTDGMKLPFLQPPERIGKDVIRALEQGREVVYTPWYWGPIMTVINLIPETLFKRLNI